MHSADPWNLGYLPHLLTHPGAMGIGIVGAGFIVCDCHLVAYADAGFRVVGLTSRTRAIARSVAELRDVPQVFDTVAQMLHDPAIEVVDVAVPPDAQPGV